MICVVQHVVAGATQEKTSDATMTLASHDNHAMAFLLRNLAYLLPNVTRLQLLICLHTLRFLHGPRKNVFSNLLSHFRLNPEKPRLQNMQESNLCTNFASQQNSLLKRPVRIFRPINRHQNPRNLPALACAQVFSLRQESTNHAKTNLAQEPLY